MIIAAWWLLRNDRCVVKLRDHGMVIAEKCEMIVLWWSLQDYCLRDECWIMIARDDDSLVIAAWWSNRDNGVMMITSWWLQLDDRIMMISAWWSQLDDRIMMIAAWWSQLDDRRLMIAPWWSQLYDRIVMIAAWWSHRKDRWVILILLAQNIIASLWLIWGSFRRINIYNVYIVFS